MEENKKWLAKWIWSKNISIDVHEIVYFRRTFHVEDKNCQLVVNVSADSRYRLFLNGQSICVGPLKGDSRTHYYETVNLSPYLKLGKNVLAAKVVHYSSHSSEPSPESIWHSPKGGFLLEGSLQTASGNIAETLDTNNKWKCFVDHAIHYEAESWISSIWLGGVERVEGAKLPHGWELVEYSDDHWKEAVPFLEPQLDHGLLTPWQLTRRTIPFLYEEEKLFTKIMRIQEDDISSRNIFTKTIAQGTQFIVELDAGELTTGYLNIKVSGGKGAKISILPSECYEKEDPKTGRRIKGIRDEISEGSKLLGDSDIYIVGGYGTPETLEVYEPFWWRTFRFVRLKIEVSDEPITIHSFTYRETGYPLEVKTNFQSSDATMTPLWDVSVRTLKRCMHETYEDCPYYEQLQYAMDTRLQILFTYSISGDDRLARKAIFDYHSSLLPSGMLQSRYPSVLPQVIPGFSIYWILMVHDHYQYFGDVDLVKRYRPTVDAVLDWFDRKIGTDGLVDNLTSSYWNFVDWVAEWHNGIPGAVSKGPLTIYNLMYAVALLRGAELNEWTGRPDVAKEYRERAEKLKKAILSYCWSEKEGLFRDGPNVEEYSQHVQIWSVLLGVVEGEKAKEVMEKVLKDHTLSKVSYAMAFFLFRALSKTGLYLQSFDQWDTWRNMLKLNLTTWVEDPVGERSDCHAWGAAPLYEFTSEILGVQPDLPGYGRILVQPQLGNLSYAKGSAATPHGLVYINWEVAGDEFKIKIDGPKHIPLTLKLPNGENFFYSSASNIDHKCLLNYFDEVEKQ
ncbi:alpha-L-rhamnosidase N-terminal domain-containing protein [Bacillus sp. FJAT-49711]|uniref:alpha-L-rhamnosidase-related protein n=1 Tax=Bacillus sp. FJAT-49711 TaxID=2833585 RepID=UPI001BC907CE|nr:alpha-L-rhamnosidase C-terminal domain-containing protein [Bacillus sp. FJAT-49711]MBS4216952.1 alpha-L-rhamnosidase N-terminal domain-containing protein [Bacillus sp. FJAT-49711]